MEQQQQTDIQQGAFSSGVELLSKALKTVFVILAAVIIALMAWFLTCGGSFIVDSTTETVIVLKFGKYHGEYTEGWHWFLPYPITKIIRIPTRKETVVTTSFLPKNEAKLRDPKAKTLMGNDAGETLTPGIDGYALLSDNAIVHSEWALTYRIGSPVQFYRNCMSPEIAAITDGSGASDSETVRLNYVSNILRNLLDASVIEAGTYLTIDSTYYDPDRYLQAVRTILEKRIADMDIGIVMDNLTLSLVAPPLKTQAAFQEFLLARTMAEREVETARTYAVEQAKQATAEREKIISDGALQKQRTIAATAADADYFTKILMVYSREPEATIVSLYSAGLARAMDAVDEKYVVGTDDGSRTEVRLQVNREPVTQEQNDEIGKDGKK